MSALESMKSGYKSIMVIAFFLFWIVVIGTIISLMNFQNPFDDEITIYINSCIKFGERESCIYERKTFKAIPESQIVLMKQGLNITNFSHKNKCVVWDVNNWICTSKSLSWENSRLNGNYYQYGNGETFKEVSKLEWFLESELSRYGENIREFIGN